MSWLRVNPKSNKDGPERNFDSYVHGTFTINAIVTRFPQFAICLRRDRRRQPLQSAQLTQLICNFGGRMNALQLPWSTWIEILSKFRSNCTTLYFSHTRKYVHGSASGLSKTNCLRCQPVSGIRFTKCPLNFAVEVIGLQISLRQMIQLIEPLIPRWIVICQR